MSSRSGAKGKIVLNTTGIVAEVLSWSIDEKGATIEDTAMDPNNTGVVPQTFIAGLSSYTGKLTGNYDPTDSDGQAALPPGSAFTFKLYPEGDATGKAYVSGSAITTGRSRSGAVAGKIEFSCDFQGTGPLVEATA